MPQQPHVDEGPEFWSEIECARWANLAAVTLKTWRVRGKPIAPVYRFGRRVMYRAADVKAWAENQRQTA